MKFYYILGPVFAIIAMLFWAQAMVKKEKGVEYKIGPRLLLVGAVIFFHLFFTDSNIWDKLALLTMDFGIGLIVNVAFLAYHRTFPKVFLGLGATALAISGVLWGVGSLIGITWDKIKRSDAEIVMMELGPDDKVKEMYPLFEDFNADFEEAFPMVDMDEDEDLAQTYLVWVAPEDVSDFMTQARKDKENVDFVERNIEINLVPDVKAEASWDWPGAKFACNDPLLKKQWWFSPSQSNEMFKMLRKADPNKKAVVAILDTGVDSKHEDLDEVFGKSPATKDVHGHGTHCAGLAGGETDNKKGIASLNYKGKFITIKGYQALGDEGSGDLHMVCSAIIQAAEDGADVISMSLGSYNPTPPRMEVEAIEYARSLGCIVVAAAGNSNMDAKDHAPSNIEGVISVAATNVRGRKATFSNTNTSLSLPISAPGAGIHSTLTGGGYGDKSGTSMATPIVAGLIGFMRAMDPNISEAEAYKILKETGSAPKRGDKIGYIVSPEKIVTEMTQRAG